MNVWGDECLRWWMSGWWMSDNQTNSPVTVQQTVEFSLPWNSVTQQQAHARRCTEFWVTGDRAKVKGASWSTSANWGVASQTPQPTWHSWQLGNLTGCWLTQHNVQPIVKLNCVHLKTQWSWVVSDTAQCSNYCKCELTLFTDYIITTVSIPKWTFIVGFYFWNFMPWFYINSVPFIWF